MDLWYISFVAALLGLAVGSFFNVLIYRVPRNMPISWPPSHCTQCGKSIRPRHNIPLLGWLLLRGKCANCQEKISIQYPLVELLCGVLGAASVWWVYGVYGSMPWYHLVAVFWLVLTIVPIATVDFKHQLIPDTTSLGGIAIGLILAFFNPQTTFLSSFLGAIIAGGSLFIFAQIMGRILGKAAMGFGDVKLLAALGAFMGWSHALAALVCASIVALLVILPWRFFKPSEEESFAFGPFIALMGPIFYLYGHQIMDFYWNYLQMP
ncbi:MAG: prepilin peptidase [Fibrobacter sp.]|nr:prepilin peptidase [Fibrobacter sp.]